MIEQILSRVAKIMNGDRRAGKMEDMILKAYEAGRQSAVRDIAITLEDDTDDHAAAIELINANY